MAEEIDFETYLSISKNKFEIFLFDNKNLKSLYQNELKFESSIIDLEKLSKFLDENIFKIEKFAGKFVENIFLMIESDDNLQVNICIKKKNYDNLINKKTLENTLSEVKDLFKEAYQDQIIMHMIINNYLINNKNYNSYIDNLRSDNLCLEVNFFSISKNMAISLDKILEKYQIKIKHYLNTGYVKNFTKGKNIKIPEMAYMLKNGYNNNEVILVPKNKENIGFFEKFFQLFS
jgi:hypothetical protein